MHTHVQRTYKHTHLNCCFALLILIILNKYCIWSAERSKQPLSLVSDNILLF